MKRDPALLDLSKEHHTALVISKKIKAFSTETEAQDIRQFWSEHQQKFSDELLPHFEEEERRFGSLLQPPLKEEFENDHAYFRDLLKHDSNTLIATQIIEFADRLIQHVRFEERTLFPWLEEHHLNNLNTN